MTTYKILVIDDAFFIRNLIKKAVTRKAIRNDVTFEIVGEAQDAREGLELCEKLKPDIITVDFNMPELNGLDFVKYLKEQNPKIPILMISSNMDPDFPRQVEEVGCNFLAKPFQESFLWMRLDAMVDQIKEYVESGGPETITLPQETQDLLDEIELEVEAELEENNIELEEVSLPKVNPTPPPAPNTKKKKKKKKKSNDIFGMQIDNSISIKPKSENTEDEITNTKTIEEVQEGDKTLIKTEETLSFPMKKEQKKVEVKPIDTKSSKKKVVVKPIEVSSKKEESNSNEHIKKDSTISTSPIEEDEDIIIEDDEMLEIEDEAPIIIDDDDDLIIIDDDEEVIIEDDSEYEEEYDEDEVEIEIEDDETMHPIEFSLNMEKSQEVEEDLSEKDIKINQLLNDISYSYQNEMNYVLTIMQKVYQEEKEMEETIEQEQQELPDDELEFDTSIDEEFDKLFAEFNPNLEMSDIPEVETKITHEEATKHILKEAPSITQTIDIAPPRSEKVRKIYKKIDDDEDNFVLPTEPEKPKENFFTKLFNFFKKKK